MSGVRTEVSHGLHAADRAVQRAGRRLRLLRLRVAAWRRGARLELTVAPGAQVDPALRIVCEPQTTNVVRIADKAMVGAVLMKLKGGTIAIGAGSDVRDGAILNVTGELTVGAGCVLSFGVTVHSAERVEVLDGTIVGERSLITDSRHVHTEPSSPVWHSTQVAPVRLEENSWLAADVVVGMGVTIGPECVVASSAVVLASVPGGSVVVGAPAKVRGAVRRVPLTQPAGEKVLLAEGPGTEDPVAEDPGAEDPATDGSASAG